MPEIPVAADSFRSGFVAIFGRPNTGKTTLLNRLCGSKIGIVSDKPQTTRSRIMGVLTGKRCQMVLLDSPGYIAKVPPRSLDERIQQCALDVLSEAEIPLLLFDASREWGAEDEAVMRIAQRPGRRFLVALNKCDSVDPRLLELRRNELQQGLQKNGVTQRTPIFSISASTGQGVFRLLRAMISALPHGPKYYPDETLTDQSSRFLAGELIREQIFRLCSDEVPYGCAVEVISYKESANEIQIMAEIIVERDSLKGIIIGQKGAKIKEIGTLARTEFGRLVGKTVHLQLFVKVFKDWRKNQKAIKQFGY